MKKLLSALLGLKSNVAFSQTYKRLLNTFKRWKFLKREFWALEPDFTQLKFTSSKSTIETLGVGPKYFQS